ncbi:MAG: hypothetical protein A2X40_07925 [Elusimicrobia bacterium GWC2_65_9]|nr:MAG: hypothetical protein A2X40_07925 [Elusimicrobia bacterium GWC2_65_9]
MSVPDGLENMSQGPQLSVVLPTLDEAAGLRVLLPRLEALFSRLGVSGEVLVVDGGSRDETTAVAAEQGARVLRQKGRGFGSAVREGLQAAGAEWVALMDADGSHAPEDLERFWARRQEARLIVGSRYCRGGSADMPWLRQVLSRALNIVTRRVLDLPVRESSSGLRLYHGPSARAVPSVAMDFSIQQELLVGILAKGGRVVEEPIHYAPRLTGESKANAWELAFAYARMLLRLKPQRGGWRVEAGLFCTLTLGLATGLCGITGGLPGTERWRALPEGLRRSPVFARSLADSWRRLYEEIKKSHDEMRADEPRTSVRGVVEIAPGWTFPPDELVNAARALLTQTVNPDEKKSFIILAQMRPWRLELKPLYVQYGGAFIYPLGAFLGGAHLLHLARLTPDLSYYLAAPEAMARLYLLGRLFTLLFHLGTLWLLYELGRILSGRRTGTAAALLWALAPVAIINAHILKPHPVAAFFFLAGAYFMVRAVEEGRGIDALLCGLGMGLAAGGNLVLGFGLCAPLLARLCRREGSWIAAGLGSVAGLGAVIVTNPFLVFSPRDFAWELTVYSPSHFALSLRGLAVFALRVVPEGLGAALAALAAAGLARALFQDACRRAAALLALGGIAVVLLRFPEISASTGSLRLHYPVAALGVLFAADLLSALPSPALAGLLLAGALADTGLRGAVHLENLRREAGPSSTKTLAAGWVDANIPAGASVGLLRYPEPAHTPSFRWDRLRLVVFESSRNLEARPAPEWVVASASGWDALDEGLRNRYDEAQSFPPARLLWAAPRDDSFYADAGMTVRRRRP